MSSSATADRVIVWANSPRGQFYALSTLLQILAFYQPSGCMPGFFIQDAPAMSFPGFSARCRARSLSPVAGAAAIAAEAGLAEIQSFFGLGSRPGAADPAKRQHARRMKWPSLRLLAGRMGIGHVPGHFARPGGRWHRPRGRRRRFRCGHPGRFPVEIDLCRAGEKTDIEPAAEWFERFMRTHRFFKAQGKRLLVPGGRLHGQRRI